MNIQCIKVINEVPWYGTGAWGDEKLRLLIHGEDMKRRRGRKLRWPGWNAGVSRATRDQSHQLAGKHGDARPIAWLGRSVSEAACLRREHRLPDLCCHPPGWNHQRTYTLTLTVMHYFNSLSLCLCVYVCLCLSPFLKLLDDCTQCLFPTYFHAVMWVKLTQSVSIYT